MRSVDPAAAAELLRRRHRHEIVRLLSAARTTDCAAAGGGLVMPPRLEGRSLSVRLATVVTCASYDTPEAADAPPGSVFFRVSVSAHHRRTGRFLRVDPGEADGWARAVYGPRLECHAYCWQEAAAGDTVAAHFVVYLDADRATPTRPPSWHHDWFLLKPLVDRELSTRDRGDER